MASIMIENLFKKTIQAVDHTKTLLEHFQDHGIDWMHACGAKGRCTTCKALIIRGAGNLTRRTGPESKYHLQGALRANERLACQAKVAGDVCIAAPREYQLPHVRYSDETPT
jgi:ferredoxin, 2Fe-2S